MFVDVIVNIPNSNVDKVFEYEVKEDLIPFIHIGSRIEIPFGESSRLITGYITSIHEDKRYDGYSKEIVDIPELYPLINEEQFKIAEYLKKNTICPMCRIFNSMIPEGLKGKTYKYLKTDNLLALDPKLTELFNGNYSIKITKPILEKYSKLIDKGLKEEVLSISYEVEYNNQPKLINVYYKNDDIKDFHSYKIKESIITILEELNPNLPFEKIDLNEMGINDYYISKFIKLNLLKKTKILKSRIIERNFEFHNEYYFNNSNSLAIDYYNSYSKTNKDILWIPNNENTLIEGMALTILDNIKNNKNTLIVVPDVLSSYKISYLLKNYLGIPVLTINSNIHEGELLDDYFEVLGNDYKVFVTTTISIIWPYHDLGSIYIIDSESDNYLLEQSPRLNTLELMKFRSRYQGSKLIYESYVPEVGLFSESIMGDLYLIDSMKYLVNNKNSLNVEVVDMKDEIRKNNLSPLSNNLKNSIIDTIKKNKNVLLILNNKGYSDFVICRTCGYVSKCDKCGISHKYVSKDNRLVCPSCGRFKTFNNICPECGSKAIKFMGLGAEKLKEILESEIDDAKVAILDSPKYSTLKQNVEELANGDTNIIISTDTYMRGLVNSNIGLVGIMSLDLMLKAPLYNADIKSYSMLYHSYVLGNNDVKMIVQSYNPDNFVLKNFINNDYFNFYKESINNRNILQMSPFYKINRIYIKGKGYNSDIFTVSKEIIGLLKQKHPELLLYGPTYNYTFGASQIIVKTKDFNNYDNVLDTYKTIYEGYKGNVSVIFDNYPKSIS